MFEVRIAQGSLLKKILEAMKELVAECNWECSSSGISIQAMDSSHVSLINLELDSAGFEPFRCDKNLTMGVSLTNLSKIIKCSGNDDSVTLRAADKSDSLDIMFESPNGEKSSMFVMKQMDIDSEHLGIPDTVYEAIVRMPSHEFQRICRDLSQFGDSLVITCTKDGVQFSSSGDIGSAKITLRQNSSIEGEKEQVSVELTDPVALTFACRYLNHFTRATPLASTVSLSLKSGMPLVCEYKIEDFGHIRYYLAPKVEDEDEVAHIDDCQ